MLGTLDEVKAAAIADLCSPEGAWHALFYGETILLQCWEGDRLVAAIDLHPFITYRLSHRVRPVRFKDEGAAPAPGFRLMQSDRTDELAERVADGEVTAVATITWDRVPVPALAGDALPMGAAAQLNGRTCEYGFHAEWDNDAP